MREVLNLFATCLIIIVVGLVCKGTIENQFTSRSLAHDSPMLTDEVVTLPEPKKIELPNVPEVRLSTFEDEFAVRSIVRNLTEEEKELLVQISMAEAGNQDTEGKMLIMLCVLNRCENSGQTVRQVIFAPHQFATSGMCRGSEDAYLALEGILHGWDESQGATSFRTGHYHEWGTPLFQHQAHYFSK